MSPERRAMLIDRAASAVHSDGVGSWFLAGTLIAAGMGLGIAALSFMSGSFGGIGYLVLGGAAIFVLMGVGLASVLVGTSGASGRLRQLLTESPQTIRMVHQSFFVFQGAGIELRRDMVLVLEADSTPATRHRIQMSLEDGELLLDLIREIAPHAQVNLGKPD